MNKIMCFLTGGHRYSDANIRTQTMPDDWEIVEISNPCIKCGNLSKFYINTTIHRFVPSDIKNKKGGE